MIQKIFISCFFVLYSSILMMGSTTHHITSPDGHIVVTFEVSKKGDIFYRVVRGGEVVLSQSRLGLKLKDVPDMITGFSVANIRHNTVSESWNPIWGEESVIENNYNEMAIDLMQEKIAPGREISIVFRVFNDGIGFRYEFPRQAQLGDFVIMDELTEFAFTDNHTSWSLPVEGIRFYEGLFRELPIDKMGWASTPVTMRTDKGLHLALHEANLTDFAAMNVRATPGSNILRAALTPWSSGEKVFVTGVRVSPWRTLIVTDNASEMMLSRLMLNLNEPCRIMDTSWIKPQRYIGVWWCYHMKTHTWHDGPQHGATTENTIRYMDFAAENNFGGVLVEGWNPDWKSWNFDYVHPYKDFDITHVNNYGRSKGVVLIGHHETGGRIANYERQMEDGFKLYRQNGMHYVKTGYVGDLLDNKEYHSSQFGVRHYRKVIETAAKYQIAIDNHEPVIPTGLQRTWPNLMTQEGVRGQEWNAWNEEGGNPPEHTVTLPFTRGLAGPMDFTPVIFNFENDVMPQTHPNTTLAKQLALFVILYSPLQMAADMIENYENNPGPFQFVCDCPTDWDKTIYPEAEIGKYITVARKSKGHNSWYLATATGTEARTANISLSFLYTNSQYKAIIYRDGCNADWEKNPYPVEIETRKVTANTILSIPVARGGGAVVKLFKI